ncbi:hypothetical protein [Actinomadura fibrosa]|uniref:Secreted protein n=1 Tax=Actinomadura fibrosa TaxID=111802 RepID=A0ABW2XTN9_9ACTN|nr:hypothetical protein [Actinomadura fibrosa]
MREVWLQQGPARSWPRVLFVLLALVTALTMHADVTAAVEPGGTVNVHSVSPGCGDEDDDLSGRSDPSAVRPGSAVPGRPASVRLPRTFTREFTPVLPRPALVPRATTPVAADGRAPGAGVLIALRVSRT